MFVVFESDCLAASDDDSFVDVFGDATARKVVDGGCETLENGTYGLCACKTLNEFVADVAHFKRGEYENVCTSAEGAVGRFAACNAGNDSCIGLQFAVEDELGSHFVGDFCGFDNLVDTFVACAAFG